MPDWSYLTLFRPMLFRLPAEAARDVTLGAIGSLARVPGGPMLIALLGHMDPPACAATSLCGLPLGSPVGAGADLDPHLLGTRALARFGFGFIEVGPVTQQPLAERCAPARQQREQALASDAGPQALERLVDAGRAASVDGWVVGGGIRTEAGKRVLGPAARAATVATLDRVRARVGEAAPIVADAGVEAPEDALAVLNAGASHVELVSGLVYSGPGLPKRINEAIAISAGRQANQPEESGRAWRWLLLLGLSMLLGGVLAWIVAAVRVVLPYDEAFLGIQSNDLVRINPRVLPFMAHDRVTLAGTMLSIGVLYTQLAWWGVRKGAHWAYQTIAWSSGVGFATFFLFLGFGYFDPLHAFVSVVLLVFYVLGVRVAPRGIGHATPDLRNDWRWRLGLWGQLTFVATGAGLMAAGLTIAGVGITTVLVAEDAVFIGALPEVLRSANDHLLPLIAHDRAGFGGALVSNGIAVLLVALWGFRARAGWVWWTLLAAGLPGFAAAFGVHATIGYLDAWHLAPAAVAALLYGMGLLLSYPFLCAPSEVAYV